MNSTEKYKQAFCETFQIETTKLQGLTYQSVQLWDSVGHMALIAALEEAFDIMMDTEDIIDLSTFEKGMEILSNNYDVKF